MNTYIEKTRQEQATPPANDPLVGADLRRNSGVWRWLALALVAGLSLTAFAQRTATATAKVADGVVTAITLTDGGAGYSRAPSVTLIGGGGTGAKATALLTSGAVSEIYVVAGGSGFTDSPIVFLSPPVLSHTALAAQMVPMLTIYGWPGDTNRIETATSVDSNAVWIPLTTVVLTNTMQEWYDRVSPAGSRRFYRAVLQGDVPPDSVLPDPGSNFVLLPPGQFVIGSPDSEVDRYSNEGPQTRVTLTHGFFLGRYQVTQG